MIEMASIYVLDEYESEDVVRKVKEATTLEELKKAVLRLVELLPIEYQD